MWLAPQNQTVLNQCGRDLMRRVSGPSIDPPRLTNEPLDQHLVWMAVNAGRKLRGDRR